MQWRVRPEIGTLRFREVIRSCRYTLRSVLWDVAVRQVNSGTNYRTNDLFWYQTVNLSLHLANGMFRLRMHMYIHKMRHEIRTASNNCFIKDKLVEVKVKWCNKVYFSRLVFLREHNNALAKCIFSFNKEWCIFFFSCKWILWNISHVNILR